MGKKKNGEIEQVAVPILTDLDLESPEAQAIVQYAGKLIEAAKNDSLVSIVCQHQDSKALSTILCAMVPAEDGTTASYVPVGILFDPTVETWNNYTPPKAALPKDTKANDGRSEAQSESP